VPLVTVTRIARTIAAVVLRARNRLYRRLCAEEEQDWDADGIPDAYQEDTSRS
jgi:NhaA family Na+:H+ antiporter